MQGKEDEIEQLYLKKEGRAPSTYMIEIAQLKEDNKRLMDMLKVTREFKEFAGFVDDSGGDVRHIEVQPHKQQPRVVDLPSNAQNKSNTARKQQRAGSRTGIRDNSLQSASLPNKAYTTLLGDQ